MIAVMYHMYYEDVERPDLLALDKRAGGISGYINQVTMDNQILDVSWFPGVPIIRSSPNCGKDIGGRLVLIDTFLRRGDSSDWIIFLHDKKSPHKATGSNWRSRLWEIISPGFIERALDKIAEDPQIGMIGPLTCKHTWMQNDTDTKDMAAVVDEISESYAIQKVSFAYVAGAMFWMKADIIRSFFESRSALGIRAELEKGNMMDDSSPTITHAWERLFGRIVVSSGMKTFFI